MIEVEKRGTLDEGGYNNLRNKLKETADFLGDDNKYVEYWIYKDKLLKLIKNNSKKSTVLSLKLNPIGSGSSYEEHELKLNEADFGTLEKIVSNITIPDQIIKGTQKRENYKLEEVEIAIKWSEDWGYHFELECLIETEKENNEALLKIQKVAEKLNLITMSDEEERIFTEKVRSKKRIK